MYRAGVGGLLLAAVLAGCGSTQTVAPPADPVDEATPTAPATPAAEPTTPAPAAEVTPGVPARGEPERPTRGSALAQLGTLAVKGRAPMTGYERERFGQAWADVDRNGCDTRNDILRRDLRDLVARPGTRECVIQSGRLTPDPYTGKDIAFERGGASEVDIDHVVALANAWVTGAQYWAEPKRIALANDRANLLAVDSSANRQKGAGDAATWLPARKSYRCAYVARQVAVKAKYDLWVTPAERDAIARVLGDCPGQTAIDAGPLEIPPPGRGAAATPAPPTQPKTQGVDPRFPYCKDAIAAGYGPYERGSPEYEWYGRLSRAERKPPACLALA
jgi:hypothetical protein